MTCIATGIGIAKVIDLKLGECFQCFLEIRPPYRRRNQRVSHAEELSPSDLERNGEVLVWQCGLRELVTLVNVQYVLLEN